jgi:hypothetical protein
MRHSLPLVEPHSPVCHRSHHALLSTWFRLNASCQFSWYCQCHFSCSWQEYEPFPIEEGQGYMLEGNKWDQFGDSFLCSLPGRRWPLHLCWITLITNPLLPHEAGSLSLFGKHGHCFRSLKSHWSLRQTERGCFLWIILQMWNAGFSEQSEHRGPGREGVGKPPMCSG